MRVSVVIPTRNRRELLRIALSSALLRTGPSDEILVVDDGSSDGTSDDFREPPPRVRFLRGEGRGPSAARNLALDRARGEFVAFLDSDDVWLEGGLEEQVAALAADPELGLSHARARFVDAEGAPLPTPRRPPLSGDPLRPLLRRNPITTSTVVVPRGVFEKVGRFDEELRHSMDRDLWIRIAERYRIHFHPAEVSLYRIHPEQQIANRIGMDEARCRIYEKALLRYRIGRPELVRFTRRLLARRRLRLGRLHLRAGDRDAAEKCLRAAIDLRPIVGRWRAAWLRRFSARRAPEGTRPRSTTRS